MNEENTFLVSLDEFCAKENYSEVQKGYFRKMFSEVGALVSKDNGEFIYLAPYMNYTLECLKLCKDDAHACHSLKSILDYDYVCRTKLAEWIPLSAAVLRNFGPSHDDPTDENIRRRLSELVSDMNLIVEYFLDAQNMLLSPPIPSQNSTNNETPSQS